MKKITYIYDTRPHDVRHGYNVPCIDVSHTVVAEHLIPHNDDIIVKTENVGADKGVRVRCNANNGNASYRTANCNNAASNSNDNYAGRFALKNNKEHCTTCSPRANIYDKSTSMAVSVQDDYGSLPFVGRDIAESNAESSIFQDLKIANRKRKLYNLKHFFVNRDIVMAGIDRCLQRAADTDEVRWYREHTEETADRIIREFETETYHTGKTTQRVIRKHGIDGKQRNADIFSVYDRLVQNVILIVVHEKIWDKIGRYVYSGCKGRSLLSNDRTYCMINQIRHYVKYHPDDYVLLTDIHHFYESLDSKVALGVLFETIVCPFTRYLLSDILLSLPHIPIGGTLSQMVAMIVMRDADDAVIDTFHPGFFGAFGDNRITGSDKDTVLRIKHFLVSYYAGRYGLDMKDDYHICKVSDGFRFCRFDFKSSFVNVRAEMRRRSMRAYYRGQQHYAGYKGFLMKTDSKILMSLIENNMDVRNKIGMQIRPMQGSRLNFDKLLSDKNDSGEKILLLDYRVIPNGKDSEYYIKMQYIYKDPKGNKMLCVASNGSFDIKGFFDLVRKGRETLPKAVTVRKEGVSYYFDGYHVSNIEACDLIMKELKDIDF